MPWATLPLNIKFLIQSACHDPSERYRFDCNGLLFGTGPSDRFTSNRYFQSTRPSAPGTLKLNMHELLYDGINRYG
ncbi:MAG: hypothetical protein DWI24_08035 [Planctomycetota bacterium]|nr:MAG: hypothetical protein DWI24_08035 [Planctomycetota bacterium]